MIGDFLGWYFGSLTEFWGASLRIGLPQILLIVLLVCWLRRRCGKSGADSCCWSWWPGCGGDGDRDGAKDCCPPNQCRCACGCCSNSAAAAQEDADAEHAAEAQ